MGLLFCCNPSAFEGCSPCHALKSVFRVNPRWEENLSLTTSILGAQASRSPSPHDHGIGPGLNSTIHFCLGEGSRTLGQALSASFPSDQATQARGEEAGLTQHPPARPSSSVSSLSLPRGLGALVEASSGCRVGTSNGRSKAEKLTLAPSPTRSSIGGS